MNTDPLLSETPDAEVEAAAPTALVVGHDGSACASEALETALQLATELGAPVTVVRAWSMVTAPRPAGWTFGTVPSTDELAAAVTAELEGDVAALLERFADVEVDCRAYHAGPARSPDAGRGYPGGRRSAGDGARLGQRPVRPLRLLPGAGGAGPLAGLSGTASTLRRRSP